MKCAVCGESIVVEKRSDGKAETEMIARANHMSVHNVSPAVWTEAYKKIEAGRENSKKKAKESE